MNIDNRGILTQNLPDYFCRIPSGETVGDFVGGLIFCLTFFSLFITPTFRRSRGVFLSTWLVLLITQTATIVNEYLTRIKGADGGDPSYFLNQATHIALRGNFGFNSEEIIYSQFLGNIFKVFGVSRFLGSELTVLSFLISCYLLLKISQKLDTKKYDSFLILFYGLLPSSIVIKSTLLRESFQVMFFMMTVYWGLKFQKDPGLRNVFLAVFSGLLMSLFHFILGIIALCSLIVLFFWNLVPLPPGKEFTRLSIRYGIVIILGGALLAPLLIPSVTTRLGALSILIHRDPLEHLHHFRGNSMQVVGRATYATENINISSWPAVATSMARVVGNFYFFPYPWGVRDLLDFYGLMENMWRALLLAISLGAIFCKKHPHRSAFRALFLIYCFNSFLWAIGTTNYGTAIRHHLVGYWILTLIATPALATVFCTSLSLLKALGPQKSPNNTVHPTQPI